MSSTERLIWGARKIGRTVERKIAGTADDGTDARSYRRVRQQIGSEVRRSSRSGRRTSMTRLKTLVVAGGTAAVCAAILAAGGAFASAKQNDSQTLRFLSVTQRFAMLPKAGPQTPPQIGGRLIFTDALYNRAAQFGKPAGARIGRAEGVCTIVSLGTAQCTITAHVPNGQLVVMGAMVLRRGLGTNRFGVVGGSGAYGNANGTTTGRDISDTKSVIDIDLGA
jgi:hypothetical protein